MLSILPSRPRPAALARRSAFMGFLLPCFCGVFACAQQAPSGQTAANASASTDASGDKNVNVTDASNFASSPGGTAVGAGTGAAGTLVGSSVSCGGVAPVKSLNTNQPASQWSLPSSGPIAQVNTKPSRFGTAEQTDLFVYSTLIKNANGGANETYLLSIYNYDPCTYEEAHGALTMPRGGSKVEMFLEGSGASQNAP